MSIYIQKQIGVIIGKDYPRPIDCPKYTAVKWSKFGSKKKLKKNFKKKIIYNESNSK